jgi:hypothetical protein
MEKFVAFEEKYKAASSEEEKNELLKNYMLTLSPDELHKFLVTDLVEIWDELLSIGDDDAISILKKSLEETKVIVKKGGTTDIAKAA